MSLQDVVKETERQLKKIYLLKMRKYMASIYLSIGLYYPVLFILTLFHLNSSAINLLKDLVFISIISYCTYVDLKLGEALGILRRLHNIVNKGLPKYYLTIKFGGEHTLSVDLIGITLFAITVIVILFGIPYLQYVMSFALLEWYFLSLFSLLLYDMIRAHFEDWLAIISAVTLLFIPLNDLFSIIFGLSWITAGIIGLVRAYEQ